MNALLSPTSSDPVQRPLHLPRLLPVALLLPAGIAGVNYAIVAGQGTDGGPGPLLWGQFAWYVVQVGIVGWAVGRGISHPLLKWIVFGWILLLINLLTSAQAMNAGTNWRAEPSMAPAALMAGEMGLCVVWAFFGDTRWTWRWPAMILAAGVLYFLWLSLGSASQRQMWTELLLLQVVTLSVLCGLLRLFGFRLLVLAADEAKLAADDPRRRRLQFGIKHVLIWTTALAVLLGIAKGLDLLRWQVAQELVRYGLLWKLTVATTSAMVIIVALWVALGRGHWALRYSAGLIFTLLIGGGLGMWSMAKAAAARARGWRGWSFPDSQLLQLYEVGWWWLGWLFLCGGLLAATLIILRVLDYRLVRVGRRSARIANGDPPR
jgi:hypothetical protein